MSAPAISVDSSHVTFTNPSSGASSRRTSSELPPLPLSPRSPSPLSAGGSAIATTARKVSGRTRSALLQFYGITENSKEIAIPEIDRNDLDAEVYVEKLVETAGLKELLKKENELLNDIRGFDGERKALVYDNYSKLITATDTIRKMRASMEPLTPTTSTLEPAIAHIAQVSASLIETIPEAPERPAQKMGKKEVVRWALGTPERVRELRRNGRIEEAEREMRRFEAVLDAWKDVKGAEELRKKGRDALNE